MNSAVGLEVEGLVCVRRGRRVVDGLDLVVRPGEVVGILGPNGAGKSTSFRMILGMERLDAGVVRLDGRDLRGRALWQRVRDGLGYLPQEASVFRKLTVRQNLRVAVEARASDKGGVDVEEVLQRAGLSALAESRAGNLSGGERRKLEIARCLCTGPRIVLFDEPFSGVDPIAIRDLKTRIRGLANDGIGILITDHAVREMLSSCDRALLLDKGKVVAAGTPERLADEPVVRSRYLGPDFRLQAPAP